MASIVDLSGLDRLQRKLGKLQDIDATPLMATWMQIVAEDNRDGIMAGLDKDGNPMAAVTYRPKNETATTKQQRNGGRRNAAFGQFGGFGPMAAGLHNNLSPAEYRRLSGPPLAPRGVFSRVISNLRTSFQRGRDGTWQVVGAWFEVVSTRGVKFLSSHFNGSGNSPQRDLRGVRPSGRQKAREAALAWMRDYIRMHLR